MRSFIKSHRKSLSTGSPDIANKDDNTPSSTNSINTRISSTISPTSQSSLLKPVSSKPSTKVTHHTTVPLHSLHSTPPYSFQPIENSSSTTMTIATATRTNSSSISPYSRRRSDIFDTTRNHSSFPSQPASGSLRKLNPISYIRRRRASNDESPTDLPYIPSPEEYKEAGSIFGTRTHDWGSTPSTTFCHPIPVFSSPPNRSYYSNSNINDSLLKNPSFRMAAGKRSVSASAVVSLSSSSPLSPTLDPIKMSRLTSPGYSDSGTSQAFSLSPSNSMSNSSDSSYENNVTNANINNIPIEPRTLSPPNMVSTLSSELVKEEEEEEEEEEKPPTLSLPGLSRPSLESECLSLNSLERNQLYADHYYTGSNPDVDLNNASSLDIASLTKKISNLIRNSKLEEEIDAANVPLPNSPTSPSFDSITAALVISKTGDDNSIGSKRSTEFLESENIQNGHMSEIHSQVANEEEIVQGKDSYSPGLEDADDAHSMFSFEEDSKMGRNSSINYHKPALLQPAPFIASEVDLDNFDDVHDYNGSNECNNQNELTDIDEMDDLDEMNEMEYDEMIYDYDDGDEYIEDDAHLFGAPDTDSVKPVLPRAYYSDNIQSSTNHNQDSRADDSVFENSHQSTDTENVEYDQFLAQSTPSLAIEHTQSEGDPNPTMSFLANGLGGFLPQYWISQKPSMLARGQLANFEPVSNLDTMPTGVVDTSMAANDSNSYADAYTHFSTLGSGRSTSISSTNSTATVDTLNSLHSIPSLNDLSELHNQMQQLVPKRNEDRLGGTCASSIPATLPLNYSSSNYPYSVLSPYLSAASLDDDTNSNVSTNYCSAIDYDEQGMDVQTELGNEIHVNRSESNESPSTDTSRMVTEDGYLAGTTNGFGNEDFGSTETVNEEGYKNTNILKRSSDVQNNDGFDDDDMDFDDSLLDEINSVPEDYGDSDDDLFCKDSTSLSFSTHKPEIALPLYQTVLARSMTHGRNSASITLPLSFSGLRKAKSYSFDKKGAQEGAFGTYKKGQLLRRQTSIIRNENVTTTLFSPLSRHETECYYNSIPKDVGNAVKPPASNILRQERTGEQDCTTNVSVSSLSSVSTSKSGTTVETKNSTESTVSSLQMSPKQVTQARINVPIQMTLQPGQGLSSTVCI